MKREVPEPWQQSVWDYPRPPALQAEPRRVRVVFNGMTIADSTSAWRVLETSHPPGIYVPADDLAAGILQPNPTVTVCEWKGRAVYWDAVVGDRAAPAAGWSYPEPSSAFSQLRDAVSFYPSRVDACYLDEELVTPQQGDFYGGWITADIVGPFKGGADTWGW